MYLIPLKALSLNSAYRGRRFITPELKAYKTAVVNLSPRLKIPEGRLQACYMFGVSSKQSDVDNLIKCFQDALSEKYGFNDKLIYKIIVEKQDVKKGAEFVGFSIESYQQGVACV